uniref:Uncharacterized protein n=1 Tax=Ixodes ricinus TaxID=34613 RepID=V5IDA9_IXORI
MIQEGMSVALLTLLTATGDEKKNRFSTLSDCRKTCRGGVPFYCFNIPPTSSKRHSYPMVTYNSSKGACEVIPALYNNPQKNIFRRNEDCIKK